LEEHNDHLLTCSRAIQEHTRQKIIDYIWHDNTNHGNLELNNIIKLALFESAYKETWQPLAGETLLEIRKCIIHQNTIGWNQLVKGRITKEMRKVMDNHYQKLNLNTRRYTGERWCKLLIKNIWQVILQLWKQRNEIIHDLVSASQLSKTQERLATRVHKCYEWKDTLTLADRERIFYTDANQLLQEDQRLIKAWIQVAERIIKTAKKENKKSNNSRRILESFVQWKPRSNKKPKTAAELQPD
jgi:hypothetical protein